MTIESFLDARHLCLDTSVGPRTSRPELDDTIEEDQLARTFQEIVNFVDMDNVSSRASVEKPEVPAPLLTNTRTFSFSSFLDDEWIPIVKSATAVECSARNDNGSKYFNDCLNVTEIRDFKESRPVTPFSSISSKPPLDYICKLCNSTGHYIKDCRLFQPRASSSFKSYGSNSFSLSSSSSTVLRSSHPPSNYICRLCNVSGHWIDQCSKFQPKQTSTFASSNQLSSLPPVMGPTTNYRPPAYLSKPVPSNYLCNLCNRPGHWIQQCSQFIPIIKRK